MPQPQILNVDVTYLWSRSWRILWMEVTSFSSMLYVDKVCMYIHWLFTGRLVASFCFYSHLPSILCYPSDSWLTVCGGAVWYWQQPHCHAWHDHFIDLNKNSKCSLGLGCIYSQSHGNYLCLLQLITLFMWPWTLINLSESLVLKLSRISCPLFKIKHAVSSEVPHSCFRLYIHFLVIGTWF
jgi:hypothetical protein